MEYRVGFAGSGVNVFVSYALARSFTSVPSGSFSLRSGFVGDENPRPSGELDGNLECD
jgi:hypothetical protein